MNPADYDLGTLIWRYEMTWTVTGTVEAADEGEAEAYALDDAWEELRAGGRNVMDDLFVEQVKEGEGNGKTEGHA